MQVSFLKRILLQLILFTITVSAVHAASPPPLVLEDKPYYCLPGHVAILEDPTGKLTVQQAAQRSDWSEPVHKRIPNLGITSSAIWLRFSLANRTDTQRQYYIAFEYPVTNSVAFYKEAPPGVFRQEKTGNTVSASANVVPDRHFLFPFFIGANQTLDVYLRVQSTSGMTLPVRILSAQGLSRKAIRDYTIYGILFGVLALILVYFICVGSFVYKGTCIWLVFYSILFGLHMAVRGGFLHLIIPDALVGINSILQLFIIGGLYFTGAKFFRIFLGLKNHAKALDRIMAVFQYLSVLFVVLALLHSPLITVVSLVLFVINPVFSVGLAFYFWQKRVPHAGYFAIGWIVAHAVSVYDFFRINGMVPYPVWGEWLIPFSFLIAFLFLSVALIRQNTADHLMAETDSLTQLGNRRKFDEAILNEWNRCRRLHSPFSLIVIDVDHFKKYNDSFGHRAGDKCLCHIAGVLKQYTQRAGELAVRYGGEEFVLLLPNLDAVSAYNLAETVRNTIGQTEKEGTHNANNRRITVSLGVATFLPDQNRKPEDLFLEADKAMYEAKRAGRNRTVASKTAEA